MDNSILKKRFNTFRTEGGHLKGISGELLVDFLRAYEQWPGRAAEFYRDVGISKQQFAVLMKKAKRLCREGHHPEGGEFKEIKLDSLIGGAASSLCGIELSWDGAKVIRFREVDQLVDFLKKVA
jgi:hypothetical protein